MAAETNEALFEKINDLYAQFDAIRGRENVESERLSLRNKIVTVVCSLYFLRSVEDKIKREGETNVTAQSNAFYSTEIVEKTVLCLEKFPASDSCKNGGVFSKYACASVSRMLSTLKEKEVMGEKNARKEISDCGFRLAKEIKKLDEKLLKLGVRDEHSRTERIARAKNLPVAEVERHKRLLANNTISLSQPLDETGETDADFGSIIPSGIDVEAAVFSSLELEERLNALDKVFASSQERTKPYLGALLTHRVLSELEAAKVDRETIEKLLCGKQFASTTEARKVVQSFFGGGEFVTQEELAAWFKRGKTDASRTLGRFLEKVRKYR